jgi:transcription antitermination factor NusG
MYPSPAANGTEQNPWYVIMVRSNHEKRIAQALNDRDIEHFLPCYRSIRQWKDRRVTLELPLFPGYVFVRICLNERLRVLTVPHVFSFVGTANSASTVPESEIDSIRRGVEHGRAEPHPYWTAGEEVLVSQGPMCGLTGILLRQQGNSRVVVSVQAIARSFVLEIDSACIQPLGGNSNQPSALSIQPAQRFGAVSPGILPSKDAERPSAIDLH